MSVRALSLSAYTAQTVHHCCVLGESGHSGGNNVGYTALCACVCVRVCVFMCAFVS